MATKLSQPRAGVTPRKPAAPKKKQGPGKQWNDKHPELYDNVKRALQALPLHFKSNIVVAGIGATDVFAYNTALGTAIEVAVVDTLNAMRNVWDPHLLHQTYSFVRHSQSFPDVRLEDAAEGSAEPILMGIEVKGWFALSKEAEPSFRYLASPSVCQPQDLLMVVPWRFDNVISGSPLLLPVFIEEARHAAEFRNHHWTWVRGTGAATDQVIPASHQTPYPSKADLCSDKPVKDGGSNFGRIARSGIMKDFATKTLNSEAAGIPIKHWIAFLRVFTDGAEPATVEEEMTRLARAAAKTLGVSTENKDTAISYLQMMLRSADK